MPRIELPLLSMIRGYRGWFAAVATAGLWLTAGALTVAEEFKVENSVYQSDQNEPASRSITYFVGGDVYDCLKEPAEVTIFERSAERFVLIDIARRIRTEVSTKDIATFTQQLQRLAAENADPLVKFSAEPTFHQSFDEATHELTLGSQWIHYRVVLVPEASQEVVTQYREFSDWEARLNAMLIPGSLPPFGRLAVNAAIAQHRAMVSQVSRTVSASKAGQPATTIRSEHHLVRPLPTTDREYVGRLRAAIGDFKLVSFDQYRKAEKR